MNIELLNARLMYSDRAKIYREEEEILCDLSKATKLKLIAEDEPCKLSVKEIDKAESTDMSVSKESFKLFTSLAVDIRRGDTLEIKGKRYTAGETLYYPYHKEIMLKGIEI